MLLSVNKKFIMTASKTECHFCWNQSSITPQKLIDSDSDYTAVVLSTYSVSKLERRSVELTLEMRLPVFTNYN